MREKLPEGWAISYLENCAVILDSYRKPVSFEERCKRIEGKSMEALFPYYGATGKIGLIDDYLLDGRFVLIGEDGAPFFDFRNRVAYIVNGKIWVNNHAHVLLSNTDNDFLCYFLNQFDFTGYVTGTTRLKLTQGKLRKIPVKLPPLNEQKRIVAKLDAIMPRIEAVKERLEKIPSILKRFRQSVLTAAVTGKLTEKWREEHPEVESADGLLNEKMRMDKQHYASYWNDFDIPQKWICALLKNIADLRLGKMLDSSKNKGVSMLYLRNINVRWFGFDLESLKEIRITQAEKEALSIQPGDVFVCEGGEPGRSAVWKASESNITFQKALHRVRMKIAFLPDLLVYNLKVDADKQKLDELFTGSTIKHFTGRSLAAYPVAIPPLDEQKEIVRQVDKLFTLADKVEEHYQKARARVDALAQSVLAKAFRGELVPQNPDDEPAEILLQRIQEEKAKMETELKTASRSAHETRKNGATTQRARSEEKQASEP